MKILKILPLLIVFISLNAVAQDGQFIRKKKEQIKALKVAFITDELSLTSDEAAKFWPLFNAFEDKQQEIKTQKLKGYLRRMDDNSFDKLSEKDAATMLTQMESTEDELYQLKKKFVTSLKVVISPVKILKLKKAEENFNRKLLQQYRDRKLGK
ncbi:sensor of ECF-type sigma factor [Flavobacterium paronense]|uniref:Sensor of ECF-type sigma factor n=1 Tax=Flavobacterium paronense TaxID=1392775 RepID=A0ABV5GGB5_9FLAO|nr:sensor of ECF-type sigma factor [Flavobacterium paronense]MDN3677037.1 sensor of ECF-type sigma factor [Flavobacterium paronense]